MWNGQAGGRGIPHLLHRSYWLSTDLEKMYEDLCKQVYLIITYRLPPYLVRYVVVDKMQPYLFLKYYYFSLLFVGKMENVLHFKT